MRRDTQQERRVVIVITGIRGRLTVSMWGIRGGEGIWGFVGLSTVNGFINNSSLFSIDPREHFCSS